MDDPASQRVSLPFSALLVVTGACWLGVRAVVLGVARLRAVVRDVDVDAAIRSAVADPFTLGAAQLVAFGAALALALRLYCGDAGVRAATGVAPVRGRVVALAIAAGFALQFPLAEVANLFAYVVPVPLADQILRAELVTADGPLDGLAIVFAFVVVAPVTEEVVFRGLLLPGLAERYGPRLALGATSLAFGLIHVEPGAMVYATIAGLALGFVRLASGSVLPAIAMHAATNAVPVLLPESVVSIPGLNTVSERVYHLPLALTIGGTATAAAALVFLARATRATGEADR